MFHQTAHEDWPHGVCVHIVKSEPNAALYKTFNYESKNCHNMLKQARLLKNAATFIIEVNVRTDTESLFDDVNDVNIDRSTEQVGRTE